MSASAPAPADARVRLIRPLLEIPKAELLAFAKARRIKFREDASNASLDFQRNRIRHELLPLLLRNYQPALDKAVLRVMDIVREEGRCVRASAEQWLKRGRAGSYSSLPVAMQRQVLQLQLVVLGIEPDFEMIERLRAGAAVTVALGRNIVRDARGFISRVENSAELAGKFEASILAGDGFPLTPALSPGERENTTPPVGKAGRGRFTKRGQQRLSLLGEQAGVRGNVARQTSRGSAVANGSLRLVFTGPCGTVRLGDAKLRWEFARFDGAGGRLPKFSSQQEFFDADKVGGRICLRHWRPGDRFQPIGMGQPVKLQDLFTNLKVPRAARHRRWLAATESGEIFWVEGLRIGEQFKLDKTTRRWLKWQWSRGVRSK